ncbi:hypothetical protein Esti_000830 [Eimeria stiedai]
MALAFHGLSRPSRSLRCFLALWISAVCALGVGSCAAAEHASAGTSPRMRLEMLVRGAPLAESTTMVTEGEFGGDSEAQPVSQLGIADRFRLIVQSERGENSPVATESAPVLHPMKKANVGRPAGRKGMAGKVALGLVPTAALFSQVLLGSRMKADVLEDISPYSDPRRRAPSPMLMCASCEPSPTVVDSPFFEESKWVKAEEALNSKTAEESKWVKAEEALTSKTAIGITAAVAALASLYLFKEAWDHWKGPKQMGLLNSRTAKWDLEDCLLIVDVHEAEDSGSLQGRYVAGSVSIQVDVNTQRATLSYSRIPSTSKSFWRSIFRKREVVHEHFSLPADHCFVAASTSAAAEHAAGGDSAEPSVFIREYKEKTFFRRERVAALAVKVQKSPGPQALKKSSADPGPPPRDLLDAIQLKHQTTGVNAVEVEETLTAGLEKDPAVQPLGHLVADPDVCGGSILCVDSVSIAANKNLCTVHAAVDDVRPIAVLADVPQQTLSIVVGSTDFAASDEGLSRATAAEFQIALPRHCAIGEGSRAFFTVAPFTVQIDNIIDFANASVDPEEVLVEEVGLGKQALGDDEDVGAPAPANRHAQEEENALDRQGEAEAAPVVLEGEAEAAPDVSRVGSEEGVVQEGANAFEAEADELETRTSAQYQHVRIQFRPLRSSDLTVTLSTLPERLLRK